MIQQTIHQLVCRRVIENRFALIDKPFYLAINLAKHLFAIGCLLYIAFNHCFSQGSSRPPKARSAFLASILQHLPEHTMQGLQTCIALVTAVPFKQAGLKLRTCRSRHFLDFLARN